MEKNHLFLMSGYPVFVGAGRRWLFRHLTIALVLGLCSAEAYWRFYEIPRRKTRDEYYRKLGVEWTHIIT